MHVMSQRLFQEGLVLYGGLIYLLLVWSVQGGRPMLAVLWALTASPLLLLVLRLTWEEGQPGLIDLKNGSWSFQLGDTFVLTTAFAVATIAWMSIPHEAFFLSGRWMMISLLIGIAAGMAFHAFDTVNYTRDGVELALNSPTKLAHDFVAYPVLLGGLVCVGVPVLKHWSGQSWTPWVFTGLLFLHLVLMGLDAYRGIKGILRPINLHPLWDAVKFALIRQ
jgi:hypothetical protein